ncbi:glycosyltransferase [Mycobacterium xenopi]|uniref:Glycosyltransferase n=1 Tax=Mycobacterium xenopi TaxID=1789 RepID=A0AAD1H0V5_MYCXE|nr:glycosyltransferase [Mycobacterium xenopi]MDA3641559.1 glycosyltransferase [Mycobacterium xenopi]MDA3659540.1 glycosyltransferase [Mycobacterium xenopi]MDA3664593.1 glycosyltransferase [Mycobacterium xenopi]ORX21099.1 glycosyltransferase [Mycobacterium xenopi]SPX92815.1 putative glycosyltransferase [Mycobacterium xenopi]
MKFVVAGYGSRGDIEPCAAVGRELLRRGHEVRMAVPPNMFGFVESVGLAPVAYGPDPPALLHDTDSVGGKAANPINMLPDVIEHVIQLWVEMGTTLMSLADGADLLLAGTNEQALAANIVDYYGIPLAALHCFPMREFVPILQPPHGWLDWQITKEAKEAQRRALGLPETLGSATRRGEVESLEIQAYDECCFPGLAAEWAQHGNRRPFVGALTLELATDADSDVLSWIDTGTPPIYFGFGSMRVPAPADTVGMIAAACMRLGARALVCSGANDFTDIPHFDHVKVVAAVNHAAIFPVCRAVVHHGGVGTTVAGLRAGVPTLILWIGLDHPIWVWAAAVDQLKVGFARPFSETTLDSLVADLSCILTPEYLTRAREVAAMMTKPAESAARAADLLESTARFRHLG